VRLRSPYDREIARLALPALGALAAGPLYILADTAIVGHLGTPQLAALALAGAVVSTLTDLSDFLSYGTTAQVARLHGAGEERRAGGFAAQALWLALITGLLVAVLIVAIAVPATHLLGGTGEVAGLTVDYVRIVAVGVVVEAKLHRFLESGSCGCAAPTTARSGAWRCPRSAHWPPGRCTSSPTPRSSGTSARRSWPRWQWPARS
jgi:hypothetical protein